MSTNRIAFTQLAVERLRPPAEGRVIYWDKTLPGFGLRIGAPRPGSREGRKTWVAMGRVDGKAVMETIGTLAQVPKLAEAREKARAAIGKMKGGTVPLAERKAERARREAEAASEAEAAANTVAAAAERWLARCERDLRPKTVAGYRQLFGHDVLPRWGDRPLAAITKTDVLELLNDKAGRRERRRRGMTDGAAVQANRLLTRLRTFFGWAAANDLIATDPSAKVQRPKQKEASRDRVLGDREICAFWAATRVLDAKRKDAVAVGSLLQTLLLTGQREGETAGMRWAEVNIERRQWTIPAARAKNGKEHVVALSALAVEVLEALPRDRDLVFSPTGRAPAQVPSRAKAKLDESMLKALREDDPEAEVAPWVIHDLRRTATTIMARLGIAPHVADRVLNHTSGTIHGVARVYNKFEYIDERKAAIEALGRFVDDLVRPGGGNVVVPLRRA